MRARPIWTTKSFLWTISEAERGPLLHDLCVSFGVTPATVSELLSWLHSLGQTRCFFRGFRLRSVQAKYGTHPMLSAVIYSLVPVGASGVKWEICASKPSLFPRDVHIVSVILANERPPPTPIKTVHMALKGGVACHIWGSACHLFCRNPLNLADFYAMRTPIVWHILGAYFLQIWGVGVVRIIFKGEPAVEAKKLPGTEKKKKTMTARTARDVTGFCAFFSTQKSGYLLHILGRFPY